VATGKRVLRGLQLRCFPFLAVRGSRATFNSISGHPSHRFTQGIMPVPRSLAILCPEAGYHLSWRGTFDQISAALSSVGIETQAVPWSSPLPNRSDPVTPLLAWGYQRKIDTWNDVLSALATDTLLINSTELLRWNTTKHYLFELNKKGIPIVPTIYRASAKHPDLCAFFREFDTETLVIKPIVGAGSEGLLRVNSPEEAPLIVTEILIQPFIKSVCEHGELSLIYFSGAFSHAVCKLPAHGEFRVQSHFGAKEVAVKPTSECLELGQRAVGACPERPTYARVDIVRDESKLYIMEIELIEPELYLLNDNHNIARFAQAFCKKVL
jgi:hypothetical protein